MYGDEAFVSHLEAHGYHPRSSHHGDEMCKLLLGDLIHLCKPFSRDAKAGKLVYKLNHTVNPDSHERWNIDLVVGPPKIPKQEIFGIGDKVPLGEPGEIWLAVDAKSIMTEHGKARRNRQRDLNSLHEILHRNNPRTIVGGIVAINMAGRFRSPLRKEITEHRNIERLVEETVEIMSNIPRSKSSSNGLGINAIGAIVLKHTNIRGDKSALVTSSPAPKTGSALHYQTFLQDICNAYSIRFGSV